MAHSDQAQPKLNKFSAENIQMTSKEDSQFSRCSLLEKLSDYIISAVDKVFLRIGKFIAKEPWLPMIITVAVVGLCMLGLLRWKTEQNDLKLWAPSESRAWDDTKIAKNWFPENLREERILIHAENVLTSSVLLEALKMDSRIKNDVSVDGENYNNVCFRTGAMCFQDSILQLWLFNSTVISALSDQDILNTINAKPLISPYTKKEVQTDKLLGGISVDTSGMIKTAEFLMNAYYLEVQEPHTSQEPSPLILQFETAFLEKCQEGLPSVNVYCAAQRSFVDMQNKAIEADIYLIFIGYFVVIAYVMITTGKYNCRDQKVWLGTAALLCVGFSVGISIGAGSALGFDYGPLHTLLPFLLLGIGVDDMFVYVFTWNNFTPLEQSLNVSQKIALMTKYAGVSVLITSLTDFIAFGIGSTTVIPTLRSFCIYSAMGILGLFISTLFFFVGAFTFDQRRAAANRNACLCCIVLSEEYQPNECSQILIASKVFEKLGTLISLWPVKIAVLLITSCMICVSGYGASQLESNIIPDWFIPKDNYLSDYLQVLRRNFPQDGESCFVYLGNIDYYNKADELLLNMENLEQQDGIVTASADFWLDSFKNWLNDTQTTLTAKGWPVTQQEFYSQLTDFINTEAGNAYISDVKFHADNSVRYSRYRYLIQTYEKSFDRVRAMDNARKIVDNLKNISQSEAFTVNDRFIFQEGEKIILDEMVHDMLLAFAAVLVANLLLVANVITSLLVFMCVVITMVDVAGLMYFWDVDVNFLSATLIILSIGLAVDYSAHIGHAFMKNTGSKKERIQKCLAELGSAVFSGGFSNCLALIPLMFSTSYVFKTFFKIFILVSLLGLYHGLLFLPVALSILGPPPYLSASKQKDEEKKEHHDAWTLPIQQTIEVDAKNA